MESIEIGAKAIAWLLMSVMVLGLVWIAKALILAIL